MNDRPAMPTYEHAAPPPYIPLSGGAVTALVFASIGLFLPVFGPWWCAVVPLVIVLMSWGGISRGVRRGKVVAIIALVLSLGGAACWYLIQKGGSVVIGEAFAPAVRALSSEDRSKLERWAGTAPDRDARIDRWLARAKAARTAQGAFKGELEVPFMKWGLVAGLIAAPNYREEFEPKGDKPPALGATFWFRAPCATGDVYVAFDYGTLEKFSAAMEKAKAERPAPGATDDPKAPLDAMFAGEVDEIRLFR